MSMDNLLTKMSAIFAINTEDINYIIDEMFINNKESYNPNEIDNMIENLLQAEIFVGDVFDGGEIQVELAMSKRQALITTYETLCAINKGVDSDRELFLLLLDASLK